MQWTHLNTAHSQSYMSLSLSLASARRGLTLLTSELFATASRFFFSSLCLLYSRLHLQILKSIRFPFLGLSPHAHLSCLQYRFGRSARLWARMPGSSDVLISVCGLWRWCERVQTEHSEGRVNGNQQLCHQASWTNIPTWILNKNTMKCIIHVQRNMFYVLTSHLFTPYISLYGAIVSPNFIHKFYPL